MKVAACITVLLAAATPAAGFATGRLPLLARSAMIVTPRIRASGEEARATNSDQTERDATPPPPQPASSVQPSLPEPAGPSLDIRLLPYVLVPLLVLASQLFLTFSRDTLPAEFLGAADMNK
ncbi:hypothetical protein KFE25_005878 [Diacronema lutheri]|uniref:Uncharacterized protein n=1 Tax=Diacronema lutheri TaxID=2081491 RepID=A0A8J5XPZ4_DIALT|nr:hypothetical protein KFE25_005878 [Diacronema lutheri]